MDCTVCVLLLGKLISQRKSNYHIPVGALGAGTAQNPVQVALHLPLVLPWLSAASAALGRTSSFSAAS